MYTLLCTIGSYADASIYFCGIFETREEVDNYITVNYDKKDFWGQDRIYSLFESNVNEHKFLNTHSDDDLLFMESNKQK